MAQSASLWGRIRRNLTLITSKRDAYVAEKRERQEGDRLTDKQQLVSSRKSSEGSVSNSLENDVMYLFNQNREGFYTRRRALSYT